MKPALLLVPLVALVAVPAGASPPCPTVYRHHAPVVHHAVNYGHHALYVPFAVKVPAHAGYAYGVNDTAPALLRALEVIDQQSRYIQGVQAGVPAASPLKGQNAAPQQQPAPKAGAAVAPVAGIKELVAAKCASCHGGALGVKGNVDLSNVDAVTRDTRMRCFDAVRLAHEKTGKPSMPKDADPLTDAEVNVFREWVVR